MLTQRAAQQHAHYTLYGGACYAISKSCTATCSSGTANTGTQTFNPTTGTYWACSATGCSSCNTDYTLYGGACYANSKSCTSECSSGTANTGTQTFSATTGVYGACSATGCNSCNTGYHLYSGTCVSDTCGGSAPTTTTGTTIGSGTFTSGSAKSWSYLDIPAAPPVCTWKCNSGYSQNGTACALICNSHASSICSSGHVYWYDSCNNRQEIKENCGTRGCSDGSCTACTTRTGTVCQDSNLMWKNSCDEIESIKQICTYGCDTSANACNACPAEPKETTCSGKCGNTVNNCGQTVDCGNPCGTSGNVDEYQCSSGIRQQKYANRACETNRCILSYAWNNNACLASQICLEGNCLAPVWTESRACNAYQGCEIERTGTRELKDQAGNIRNETCTKSPVACSSALCTNNHCETESARQPRAQQFMGDSLSSR
ncbi:hypothetical protein HYT54_03605 [Candidatus Woesearchaeota archaeon]|nr:hypothetical protein [Candidatus Woesearchaeota archaeon]